jgi:ParB family chromosome partitioning protein
MEQQANKQGNETIRQAFAQMQKLKYGTSSDIAGKKIMEISLSSIAPDPEQPRKNIEASSEEIQELAASIKAHGLINPITVYAIEKGYKIVTGERRWLAAKVAGLEKIPALVITNPLEKEKWVLLQLEENIQRQDLSPLDEADAYERLKRELGLKQVEIAERVHKGKEYISKMMKVAGISAKVKDDIRKATKVAKEVIILLAQYPHEEQERLWERIKHNPTESALKSAKKVDGTKEEEASQENELSPEEVYQTLQRVLKDKGVEHIFEYISRKKAKKLLEEYSA